ncbi:MAG: hypothetical protein J7K73_00670 [Nanoarchaeota archaeon]|nr:hypothetical protein [Nanoarchaeota archaeon]
MAELNFEELEKKYPEAAAEFLEQLELLPIFLNYYPDVREDWLEEIGLSKSDIQKIKKVVDEYAKRKVELENKYVPKTREDVIKIEDEVLRQVYVGRLIKIKKTDAPKKTAKEIVEGLYPNAAIIDDEKLRKLETLTLFKEHKKRFPMNFIVFDPDNLKIIGIEIIEEE